MERLEISTRIDAVLQSSTSCSSNNNRKQKRFESIQDAFIQEFLIALDSYELKPNQYPLCFARSPFANIPDRLRLLLTKQAIAISEKDGRLTKAIRECLNLHDPCPPRSSDVIIMEVHIDLTEAKSSLDHKLLALEFEHDNFAKCQPPQYTRHYTLEYRVRKDATVKKRQLWQLIQEAAKNAAQYIQMEANVDL